LCEGTDPLLSYGLL
nr:immunoglobulin heavy chain junction region [Mus musculus]